MKTVTEVRNAFWASHEEFQSEFRKTWRQNRYNATIRSSFVMFVDNLHRDGQISDNLKNRATL